MSRNTAPVVVIRPFRHGDEKEVQQVIYEGTMDPVNEFFYKALFREIFYQAIVFTAAMMFILGKNKITFESLTVLEIKTFLVFDSVLLYVIIQVGSSYCGL